MFGSSIRISQPCVYCTLFQPRPTMTTINTPIIPIFYDKRLHGSLLGRAVEDASLRWLGFSGNKAARLNQLPESQLLFAIVSCEWLGREADTLIRDIRAMHSTVQVILCCVQPTVPPSSVLYPLLTTADPDVFCHVSELTTCLQTLMAGRSFVSAHKWADTNERPNAEPLPGWNALTERERNIIRLMAEGHKTPEIADKLFISPYTVNNHKASIGEKLDVNGGPGSLIRFVMTNRDKILASG